VLSRPHFACVRTICDLTFTALRMATSLRMREDDLNA